VTPLDCLIDDFGFDRKWLADPACAREICAEISEEFEQICLEAGFAAKVISGMEFGEVPEFPGVTLMLNGHYATLVAAPTDEDPERDIVVDWTARQFDPNCTVPLIQTLGEWRERWKPLGTEDSDS
jgi:hypothetical protein